VEVEINSFGNVVNCAGSGLRCRHDQASLPERPVVGRPRRGPLEVNDRHRVHDPKQKYEVMEKRVQVTRRVTVASHDGQLEIIGSAVVTHRFEDISGAGADSGALRHRRVIADVKVNVCRAGEWHV
jgi:hypothetical protein